RRQNRYKSIICQEDAYLLELVRRIHLNPLRAKIMVDLKELHRYFYSGHSALIGKEKREWQRDRVTNWKRELCEYLRSSPFS
ncbi:MAG: hypothetical protein V3W19_09000, partial [Desulfatiglandales bacterium]